MPTDGWMDRENVRYTHREEYHSAIKNQILSFATTWMDHEGIMLNEISQTEKDKCCIISFYVESKKPKTWTHRYREQIGGCQR